MIQKTSAFQRTKTPPDWTIGRAYDSPIPQRIPRYPFPNWPVVGLKRRAWAIQSALTAIIVCTMLLVNTKNKASFGPLWEYGMTNCSPLLHHQDVLRAVEKMGAAIVATELPEP